MSHKNGTWLDPRLRVILLFSIFIVVGAFCIYVVSKYANGKTEETPNIITLGVGDRYRFNYLFSIVYGGSEVGPVTKMYGELVIITDTVAYDLTVWPGQVITINDDPTVGELIKVKIDSMNSHRMRFVVLSEV